MSNNNPFKQAAAVKKHLKVMVFGPAGSGKTTFALTAPNAAVIDTERGTDMYAGRDGIAPFAVIRDNTLAGIESAIAFLKTGKHSFETVILDSLTPVYDVLVGALEKKSKSGEMSYREWGAVKRKMNALYNSLLDLPMHVIITAREAVEYETSGRELRKVGAKPDADKSLSYVFDFVLQMNRDKSGTVIKSRGRDIAPEGGVIKRVTWDVFAPVLGYATTGESVHLQTMDEAIEREDVTDKPAPVAQPARITEPAQTPELFTVILETVTHCLSKNGTDYYKFDGGVYTFSRAPFRAAGVTECETWEALPLDEPSELLDKITATVEFKSEGRYQIVSVNPVGGAS